MSVCLIPFNQIRMKKQLIILLITVFISRYNAYSQESVSVDKWKEYIEDLIQKLSELGARKIVLKGISFDDKKLGIATYDSQTEKITWYFHEKMPQNFHGTGDIFASVLTGALVRGLTIEKACRLAADFVVESIKATLSHKDYNWYGVDFEQVIPILITQLGLLE